MSFSTQALFMAALERGARERNHALVVDAQWANTGTVYAVADGALAPTGATLKYDFQDGGRIAFRHPEGGGAATLSQTGTSDWCHKTPEAVLAAVLDLIVPPPPTGLKPDGWADVEIGGSFAAVLIYDEDQGVMVVEHFTFVPDPDAKTSFLDGTPDPDDWDITDVDGPFWKAVQAYLAGTDDVYGPCRPVLWVE